MPGGDYDWYMRLLRRLPLFGTAAVGFSFWWCGCLHGRLLRVVRGGAPFLVLGLFVHAMEGKGKTVEIDRLQRDRSSSLMNNSG